MVETQINLFDAAVIGVMFLSCLFAFFRGFIREMLSLLAWIGAAVITMYFFTPSVQAMEPYFKNPLIAKLVTVVGLYFLSLIGLSVINSMIVRFIKRDGDVAFIDNTLGLLFGVLRGAFIVSLCFLFVTFLLPDPEKDYPAWLKEAKTLPFATQGAKTLAELAPDSVARIDNLQKTLQEKQRGMQIDPEKERELRDVIENTNQDIPSWQRQ